MNMKNYVYFKKYAEEKKQTMAALNVKKGTKMQLALDTKVGQELEVVGVICWMREMPKGGPFRFVAGIQLRFNGTEERKDMQDYVAYVKDRYKL